MRQTKGTGRRNKKSKKKKKRNEELLVLNLKSLGEREDVREGATRTRKKFDVVSEVARDSCCFRRINVARLASRSLPEFATRKTTRARERVGGANGGDAKRVCMYGTTMREKNERHNYVYVYVYRAYEDCTSSASRIAHKKVFSREVCSRVVLESARVGETRGMLNVNECPRRYKRVAPGNSLGRFAKHSRNRPP